MMGVEKFYDLPRQKCARRPQTRSEVVPQNGASGLRKFRWSEWNK